MITQRFRSLVWVAGAAAAATGLYIVSLQVASERARLEAVDQQIAAAERDIRQLQTELGTRASLRQLERWNGESLALKTPTAGQFLPSETALSQIDGLSLPKDGFAPPPVLVAAAKRSVEGNAASAQSEPRGRPLATVQPAPLVTRAPATKAERVALLDRTLIDRRSLGDIAASAKRETEAKGKPTP
jgi:hypothetical protein